MATANHNRRRKGIRRTTQPAPKPADKGHASAKSRKASSTDEIPVQIEAAINRERRNLQRADSVLGSLIVALEYGWDGDEADEPDYSDVARVLRNIVAQSIDRLDSVNLARRTEVSNG